MGRWLAKDAPRCVTAHIPVAKVTSGCTPGWSGEIEILVRHRPKRRVSYQEDAWSHRRNRHSHPVTIRTPTEHLKVCTPGAIRPVGRWLLSTASRLEDSLDLQSVGVHLALADLYEKVEFPAAPAA
jgi:hypothetical protein